MISSSRRQRDTAKDVSSRHNASKSGSTNGSFNATPAPSSGFGRAANIRRRASLLNKRIPNKSSPHVGFFRHAPPSASVATHRLGSRNTCHGASSLHMETSPFIGFFRHAPPTHLGLALDKKRQCSNTSLQGLIDSSSKKHIKLSSSSVSASMTDVEVEALLKSIGLSSSSFVDGRLPGGHPSYVDGKVPLGSSGVSFRSSSADDAASCSTASTAFAGNADTPSATYSILDRLAHWLLFPLLSPDLVAGSGLAFTKYDAAHNRLGSSIVNAILPFFSNLLRNIRLLENGEDTTSSAIHRYPARIRHHQSMQDDGYILSSECQNNDENSSSSSDDDDFDSAGGLNTPLASSPLEQAEGGLSELLALDVSVSSLAERYHAHQAFKELVSSSSISSSTTTMGSISRNATVTASGPDTEAFDSVTFAATAAVVTSSTRSQESLDYVITQIDIARMLRNASRHLDVESILSLPTMTYRSKKSASTPANDIINDNNGGSNRSMSSQDDVETVDMSQEGTKENSAPQDAQDEDLTWSWMMVPGSDTFEMDDVDTLSTSSHNVGKEKSTTTDSFNREEQQQRTRTEKDDNTEDEGGQLISDIDEDTCVICLDHFVDGDRLRVLPCKHLFHVGCIDKWLSGSSSEEECFTYGCPTCKKHASTDDHVAADENNNGTVPSWAFARLGDVLASSASTLTR